MKNEKSFLKKEMDQTSKNLAMSMLRARVQMTG
jgi:hypothetical protein